MRGIRLVLLLVVASAGSQTVAQRTSGVELDSDTIECIGANTSALTSFEEHADVLQQLGEQRRALEEVKRILAEITQLESLTGVYALDSIPGIAKQMDKAIEEVHNKYAITFECFGPLLRGSVKEIQDM